MHYIISWIVQFLRKLKWAWCGEKIRMQDLDGKDHDCESWIFAWEDRDVCDTVAVLRNLVIIESSSGERNVCDKLRGIIEKKKQCKNLLQTHCLNFQTKCCPNFQITNFQIMNFQKNDSDRSRQIFWNFLEGSENSDKNASEFLEIFRNFLELSEK